MKAIDPDSYESQMHLEAMLYLLEDPAVDRDAFEARLLEDLQLSEILAAAVDTFLALKSARPESPAVVPATPSHTLVPFQFRATQGLLGLTIAASLLVACFLGWQTFVHGPYGSSVPSLSASRNGVVLAWGDLMLDSQVTENLSSQETIELESTAPLTGSESFSVSEVPDWLVLAAMENSDNQDSRDVKVFLQ